MTAAAEPGVALGGHVGMTAYRTPQGILKVAEDEYNMAALRNEADMLEIMSGSGFTPELLDRSEMSTLQQDIGDQEPMLDGEMFRRNCIRLLYVIRERGLRHGDLTGKNIVIRNDWPWAIDWQEGHKIGDKAPQKQPFADTHLLMRTIEGTVSDVTHSFDTPRVARRWLNVIGTQGATFNLELPLKGKSFIDLGCYQGDFTALARLEGMEAYGVDQGGFRTGENSIEKAREMWGDMGCVFFQKDIMAMGGFPYDIAMMFSTWAYIVQDYGREVGESLLGRIIADCGVFFFENQLKGDGPGPAFLKTEEDIGALLGRFGKPTLIVTLQVWGRPASRSVWMVTK